MMRGAGAMVLAAALCAASARADAAAGQAAAPLLGSVPLQVRKQALGCDFELLGAGFLTAGLMFKVYGAALYVRDPADAGRILEDVPKRLEIHMLHRTPRTRMIDTANETMARNLTPEALAAVRADVDRLHAVFGDCRPGDVAALTYVPGQGTEYAVNGERRALVEGAAFAAAYFSVWLGEKPSSRRVKATLLKPYRRDAGQERRTP